MTYTFEVNKNDWCWELVAQRVWSTQQSGFVDAAFAAAWLERSGLDTVPPSPPDASGESSETGLREALVFYGLPLGALVTMQELQDAFTDAVQTHLDAFAQTRNYDSIMSAATYATSTVPKFRAEGQYAVEARDATWAKGYEILDEVLSGQRPMPSIEEVIAELPPLAWPEVS